MLGKLFDEVPNIDFQQSAMAGFSNGAIAIAVLVSMQDEFILEHFYHFCMVDHGMFHLCDLHKSLAKARRFLILVGDEEDYGRDLKIRGAKLMADSWRLVGVDFESRVLTNTGHELPMSCKQQIGQWIFSKPKLVGEQSP
jgi:predicted esterase